MTELKSLDLHSHGKKVKSQWLSSTSDSYEWNSYKGTVINTPKPIVEYPSVCELMELVNKHPGTTGDMDSCLVSCFPTDSATLNLHRDDEKLMSHSSSICTVSFGTTRHLDCVIDGKRLPNGKPDIQPDVSLPATDRSMNIMRPGAQNKMRHSVGKGDTSKGKSEIRFSISFRKIVPVHHEPEETVHHEDCGNKHKNSHIEKDAHKPKDSSVAESHDHVILGDSLVNGLNVPRTLHLFKGGIHPSEVIQLLPSCTDVLPPEAYDSVRTLTLIVGTNALNVTTHKRPVPLTQVIHDYEQLVLDLQKLFPNARIGLFNVIPRSYTCRETFYRIQMFNTIFSEHFVNAIPNIYWIRLYWEFVNEYGYLRDNLYGKGGVHLNFNGKKLMTKTITSFQNSYY